MKIKNKVLPGLIAVFFLLTSPAFGTVSENTVAPLVPLPEHANTTRNIVDALASRHYVSTALDDQLSTKIFDGFLEDLDPSKSYFLASDINGFQRLRYDMDNALRRGEVAPAFEIFNVYHRRVVKRFEMVIAGLESGVDKMDFTVNEDLMLDRSEAPWAKSEADLDDLWRKRIKNEVLNLKLADKELDKIQELLVKRYKNRLSRTRQTNSEDVYQLYMNSFTQTYDPHTQYFSPRTSENFNINMSLSLEGIGAVLQREDEYTKVVSLVPAGPADKSQSLFPDDKIIAVGQDDGTGMVDVIGWRLDEVVQLIRGKKDTVVRLDIISSGSNDSKSKTIKITRNTVKLEEQSAQSEVIEVEQFGSIRKIGVIDIPTFYIDFRALQRGDKDFKSTTADVKKLVAGLMEEGVEGIVIDLRNNGGGSLQEAKTLTGLFIDRGPTVQIRTKSNRVDILNDRAIGTIYDGPLAVLVNRLSASASEIFAGAIQDYGRGVILGSQTFGKGTVQSLVPLTQGGQLKLTQAKFYRISGESTQHKGIIPDILFPNNFDPESIGESTLNEPLPWDTIQATGYRAKRSISPLISDLRNKHEGRAIDDPEFVYLKDALAYRQVRTSIETVSLNEKSRIQEKSDSDAFWLKLENEKREAQGLPAIESLDDLDDDNDLASSDEPTPQPGISSSSDEQSEDSEEGIQGNEIAGVLDATTISSSVINDDIDDNIKDKSAENSTANKEDPEEDSDPDPYLVASSNIILDIIGLQEQTVAEQQKSSQIKL